MRISIACGGSGGHIFPAISLANQLREICKGLRILFVTDEAGPMSSAEEKFRKGLYPYQDGWYKFEFIPGEPMPYKCSLKILPFLIKSFWGLFVSFAVLRRFSPEVVVGFGSFTSVSVVLAASLMGIPTIIHEQNLRPGRATYFLSWFVKKIATSFRQTQELLPGPTRKKTAYTGNPVRSQLLESKREQASRGFGLGPDRFTVLVMGGSKGAHPINCAIVKMLPTLTSDDASRLQFLHLSGATDFEEVESAYKRAGITHKVLSFLDRMGDSYCLANLVIARSGATTIAEIACLGLPAILIPYPHCGGHQRDNADVLEKAGGAILLDQKDLSPENLKGCILSLMRDAERLKEMAHCSRRLGRPEAARLLAGEVTKLAKERECLKGA